MSTQRVVVIAPSGLAAGFGLAGVRVAEASDGLSAAQQIDRLGSGDELGVVIIEEGLYRDLPEDFLRRMRREPLPVLVPVPGPQWLKESTAHDYIVEILRRAIGYRVRLR